MNSEGRLFIYEPTKTSTFHVDMELCKHDGQKAVALQPIKCVHYGKSLLSVSKFLTFNTILLHIHNICLSSAY